MSGLDLSLSLPLSSLQDVNPSHFTFINELFSHASVLRGVVTRYFSEAGVSSISDSSFIESTFPFEDPLKWTEVIFLDKNWLNWDDSIWSNILLGGHNAIGGTNYCLELWDVCEDHSMRND